MALLQERSIEERVRTYEAARRQGIDFLLAHANADGSVGPVTGDAVTYYRVPWALALAGETAAALRLIEWIRRHALTAAGEFRGVAADEVPFRPATNTYAETCLAYGAHLLRRFDVAQRAMAFALRYQDPVTGGVFMEQDRTGADDPQLLFLTCQLGMSAVMTGQPAAAAAAGRWLRRLWEAQPDLPHRLYTVASRAGGLATRVPPDADRRHYVNESQEVRQFHYNGGIAAAFLAQLHLATGDPAWLELARAYQRFSMESTARQFEVRQVCKSAWGGGLLALITREPLYQAWAMRLGDWFVAEQEGDGSWRNSAYLDPAPSLARVIEVTAEFVVHLDTVIGAIAAGAAG